MFNAFKNPISFQLALLCCTVCYSNIDVDLLQKTGAQKCWSICFKFERGSMGWEEGLVPNAINFKLTLDIPLWACRCTPQFWITAFYLRWTLWRVSMWMVLPIEKNPSFRAHLPKLCKWYASDTVINLLLLLSKNCVLLSSVFMLHIANLFLRKKENIPLNCISVYSPL